jgi:uncharacterized SAM-binding protein YcdF (DUF218 family)
MKPTFLRFVRTCLVLAGLVLVLQLVVGIFGVPTRWSLWLSGDNLGLSGSPKTIVVLGGGGIPSDSGLLRTYYGARAADEHRRAIVIVSLPAYGDPETSSVGRMRDELVMRGIPARRVWMEHASFNTHEQAVSIRHMLGERALDDPILVVTSSYHVRRAVLCFRKEGFTNVGGLPAFNVAAEDDVAEEDRVGTQVDRAPHVKAGVAMPPGPWNRLFLNVRYGFWNNLEYSIRFARELVALAAYRLRGWV